MEEGRSSHNFTQLRGVDYKRAFEILEHASCHPKMVEDTFVEHVHPQLSAADLRMLDVGCGPGSISKRIAPFFSCGVLVEVNADMISSSDMPENVDVRIGNFLELDFSDCTDGFDFIMCSHVLYRMPRDILQQMILKMYSLLKPGGQILLVLAAPRNTCHEFLCSIIDEQEISTSQQLLDIIRDADFCHRNIEKSNDMRVSSLDDIRTILEFMLVESSPEIERVLPEHEPTFAKVLHAVGAVSSCRQSVNEASSSSGKDEAGPESTSSNNNSSSIFVLTQDDDHIIITKPSPPVA